MAGAYETLLRRATGDGRIVGLILTGSRGKGMETGRSDWDVFLVTADDVDPSEIRAEYDDSSAIDIDLVAVQTSTEFAAYALVDHPDEWDRYAFAHLNPPLDRTGGQLAELCAAKELLPPGIARERAGLELDGFINATFRGLKNGRDGRHVASHLDAAEALPYLLGFAFMSEGRVRPYNKYLDWELERHPLRETWLAEAQRAGLLLEIARRNDREIQSRLFRAVEGAARRSGYGEVIDAWHAPDLADLRR